MRYIAIILFLFNVASAQSLFGVVATDGFDADARRYLDSAGITNSSQRAAFNIFVKGMKANGLWTKAAAIYPFMGGTEAQHRWNAKDPRILDAAFRIVFNGSWTHNTNGITGNGISNNIASTWANTYFNPNSNLSTNNSFAFAIYNRTDNSQDRIDISASDNTVGGTNRVVMHIRWSDGNGYFDMWDGSATRITQANSDARGFYISSRTASNDYRIYKNGSQFGSTMTSASTSVRPDGNIQIGGIRLNSIQSFVSNRNYCFAAIFNEGLTSSEASTLSTLVNNLQTALGRNTY